MPVDPNPYPVDRNGVGYKDSILHPFIVSFRRNTLLVDFKCIYADNAAQAETMGRCIMDADIRRGEGAKYHMVEVVEKSVVKRALDAMGQQKSRGAH